MRCVVHHLLVRYILHDIPDMLVCCLSLSCQRTSLNNLNISHDDKEEDGIQSFLPDIGYSEVLSPKVYSQLPLCSALASQLIGPV